ncbi:MAG: hypothetical protein ACKOEQ_15250 [Verrucomicrobiota bacterium]
MAFFRRRKDPLEAHAQELAGKIKRLERELREAGQAPAVGKARPSGPMDVPAPAAARSPSLDRPHVARTRGPADQVPRMPAPAVPRPGSSRPAPDSAQDPLLSPMGARKFDLPAAWRRWVGRLASGPAETAASSRYRTSNSIHGLRPLRYEKRVARNRFIGLFVLLVLVLTGLARVYVVNLR